MTDCPIRFPAIAFIPPYPEGLGPDCESLMGLGDLERLAVGSLPRAAADLYERADIVDSDCRRWLISGATYAPAHSPLVHALRGVVGWKFYRATFQFTEGASMTLDEVKARVCSAIDNDPLIFVDDELIAGESGEPIEEEVLVAAVKAKVWAAPDIDEICEAATLY